MSEAGSAMRPGLPEQGGTMRGARWWVLMVIGFAGMNPSASLAQCPHCGGSGGGRICGPDHPDSCRVPVVVGDNFILEIQVGESSSAVRASLTPKAGEIAAGTWVEASAVHELGASAMSGAARATYDYAKQETDFDADAGAAAARVIVEVRNKGRLAARDTLKADVTAVSAPGWPDRFAVWIDSGKHTVYSFGFGAAVNMTLKDKAKRTATGDEVCLIVGGRPISSISAVDLRGQWVGGFDANFVVERGNKTSGK